MSIKSIDIAEVCLWGKTIGAVAWDQEKQLATFEYHKDFLASGIELAPLTMPLAEKFYNFPNLDKNTFYGLPGFLSDSLPDKFGNAIIDQWLVQQGRDKSSFSPIERLCYVGMRGMGALEYKPAIQKQAGQSVPIEMENMVSLARQVLQVRDGLKTSFEGDQKQQSQALKDILRVGTSAGGARAKAIIAWNPETHQVRSGQVKAPQGFQYWLLKFDGVNNRDKELYDPEGFGKIEYAYYLMARAAGIRIMESRLLEEGGRSHFMTKRFDRKGNGDKIHVLSLCGMAHFDFNMAGSYSYEQAMQVIRDLGLGQKAIQQQYRRMVFNIMARNQDDHTKNIAFLMDKDGQWKLSPAFDLIYSYNPNGAWTSTHQMTCNGKRDNFSAEDLEAVAKLFKIKNYKQINGQVWKAVTDWPEYAKQAGVDEMMIKRIGKAHRVS